jgi:hypothetical protein
MWRWEQYFCLSRCNKTLKTCAKFQKREKPIGSVLGEPALDLILIKG